MVCNYETGRKIGELKRNPFDGMLQAAYSPDGRFLAASGNGDLVVKVYDAATLRPYKTLLNLLPVDEFTFSPDGKRLLVRNVLGGGDEVLSMWEIASTRRLWSRYGYHGGEPAFSPDGTRMLIRNCMFPDSATLWDANQGDAICVLLGQTGSDPGCLVFGNDGRSLHLGEPNGPVLWAK